LSTARTEQDETLDKLSLAISRQRDLSVTISSELELHSSLLDETDEAVDRTGGQLRRARGRLETVSRKARDNGATCTIIGLVVILLLLIVVLKVRRDPRPPLFSFLVADAPRTVTDAPLGSPEVV
jgi:t-SNARE complex subunit (syntaxin)